MNFLFVVTHDYEFLNRACNCYAPAEELFRFFFLHYATVLSSHYPVFI